MLDSCRIDLFFLVAQPRWNYQVSLNLHFSIVIAREDGFPLILSREI